LTEAQRKWNEGKRLAAEQVIPETELASLESSVRVQEAELGRLQARQARTEELLQRHVIFAPFNALILDEAVEIGQRVDPGDTTVTLVGTDEFWVQVSLSTDQLRWVKLPGPDQPGAVAAIHLDMGDGRRVSYRGQVIQLLGDLEKEGRMARVLIRVEDPMQRRTEGDAHPLLLGSYVRVDIDAGQLENVLAIPRPALREGDRIWVVGAGDQLQIRPVRVRWRQDETVYIEAALDPGEALIISDLRVAMPGMAVKAQAVSEPNPPPKT
jgi:RND family efflux transporter MFP subunit